MGLGLFLGCFLAQSQIRPTAYPRERPFTPPRKWALVIGANEYTELGSLQYAASDAAAFAKLLEERFGFSPESVELLTDREGSARRPDVATIAESLDGLLADRRLNNGDLFIFYFSGHGIGTASGDFLMPANGKKDNVEGTGLHVKKVIQRFVNSGLRNVLFIVDACRGGEKNTFGDDLRKLGREANIAVFLSCEPGARSYEYPQFGHGAFTNFLLRALKSPDLQSPVSGALWASRVIEEVQKQVRDYTERDYPLKPQTPTGWSERTMDVLIGAFPLKGATAFKLADLKTEAEKLNPDEYADALAIYASEVFGQDRYADAAEIWRALDAIRRLSPIERMNLGFALNFMGRTLESDNEFAKMARSDADNVFTWIARIYNPSRKTTPQERVLAAKKIWALTKAEWASNVVWASLNTFASANDTDAFLAEVLAHGELTPKFRAFFMAQRHAYAGRWDQAIAQWKQTRSIPGAYPTEETVDAMEFKALVMQGQTAELERFLRRQVESSPARQSANWHFLLAGLYKEARQFDAMMKAVKSGLEMNLSDSDLLWAIRLAGLRFGEIAEVVARRSEAFPFSWKAMLARTWATKLRKGPEAILESLAEAAKFCDDEFAVFFECLRFLDETLDETFAAGRLPAERYSQLMFNYASLMSAEVEQFGYDAEAWILFNKFSLLSERFEPLLKQYEHYLGPRLDDGNLDPGLRAPFLWAAMAMGKRDLADRLWKLGGFHPSDAVDAGWLRAMEESLYGSPTKAQAMRPAKEPSATFSAGVQAFQAYLQTVDGGKPDLDALAKKTTDDFAAMHFLALAYARQGDWAKAMPLFEAYVFQRQIGYLFVQAKAVQVYFDRLIATKQFSEADRVAYNVAISGYGNPLYRRIHFGSEPAIGAYAGSTEFEAREGEMIPPEHAGTLKLTIDAKGGVTGVSDFEGKSRTFRGTVDAYGNLNAKFVQADSSWTITGKVAPASHYRTMPEFRTGAQAFLLMESKGHARFLIGRPRIGGIGNRKASSKIAA